LLIYVYVRARARVCVCVCVCVCVFMYMYMRICTPQYSHLHINFVVLLTSDERDVKWRP